ncbi:MAG TPA: peptide-methionine (S)-S-oxide reductase MsrA [Candidatus Saccharimonadales bacterium]|nr:peptide-methionine (S)-S-oxide reductase MsrA [Candidatus Saccharimonadales bacterium]
MTTYVLGGGCFWCLDAVFRGLKGVSVVECGYAGGKTPTPTYEQVSTGTTGYAEVVRITFDESIIPEETILDIFFLIHDPTTLNRQGADTGTQYRSIMLFEDASQQSLFQTTLEKAQSIWEGPIVTELKELETFYLAEEEHQDYFNKHPESGYCSIVIAPKIIKARHAYASWFKKEEE